DSAGHLPGGGPESLRCPRSCGYTSMIMRLIGRMIGHADRCRAPPKDSGGGRRGGGFCARGAAPPAPPPPRGPPPPPPPAAPPPHTSRTTHTTDKFMLTSGNILYLLLGRL